VTKRNVTKPPPKVWKPPKLPKWTRWTKKYQLLFPQTVKRSPFTVAIVVTGQISRLELRSKAVNLIRPTEASGTWIEMVMVLQQQKPTFAHTPMAVKGNDSVAKNVPLLRRAHAIKIERDGNRGHPPAPDCASELYRTNPKTPDDVMREMQSLQLTGTAEFPTEQPWEEMEQAIKNYLTIGNRTAIIPVSTWGWNITGLRATQVACIFNFHRLGQLVQQRELDRGTMFDVIVRLRDDTIVVLPYIVPVPPLLENGVPFCFTKRCQSWGGINDKTFVCARRYMHPMLMSLKEDVLWHRGHPFGSIHNELLTQSVAENYGVPFRAIGDESGVGTLPFVSSRPPCFCNDNATVGAAAARWCLVGQSLDCRPPETPQQSDLFDAKTSLY